MNPATWDDIPLFIKSGAIIPSIEVMDYIGQKPVRTVSLDIFPSAAPTAFTYYDDDGITYDYEHGVYFSQSMTTQMLPGTVLFNLTRKTGTYSAPLRWYLCKIHTPAAGVNVRINGKTLQRFPSTSTLAAHSSGGWATGKDTYGNVIWVKVKAGDTERIEARQR